MPLSSLLSGGISGFISAIAEKQKKFHIFLKHISKNYNEDYLINENIKFFNLHHEFVNIPQKKFKEFEKIMAHSYNVMPSLTSLALLLYVKKLNQKDLKLY